jgi:hypothetical protein
MIAASPDPALAVRAALASADSDAHRRSRFDFLFMVVPTLDGTIVPRSEESLKPVQESRNNIREAISFDPYQEKNKLQSRTQRHHVAAPGA